ncbi:hypothetical protein TNCT_315961 [Trichonephila clavata]|uniref:Uncharacterized protein n=1 Tax=Trichonephila clavata TaxID=2740835 RepID=A0A8X6LHY8_TRICU|nr:hypothetical protein TNCT_315961 [Trichonephila clavata]
MPPYNPDLTPNGFHSYLIEKLLLNREDFKKETTSLLKFMEAKEYNIETKNHCRLPAGGGSVDSGSSLNSRPGPKEFSEILTKRDHLLMSFILIFFGAVSSHEVCHIGGY